MCPILDGYGIRHTRLGWFVGWLVGTLFTDAAQTALEQMMNFKLKPGRGLFEGTNLPYMPVKILNKKNKKNHQPSV
jgi:hypothetical protein